MGSMTGALKHPYDAASTVELRPQSAGALTANTPGASVPLDLLSAAYWDNNDSPYNEIHVVIQVTSVDYTAMDEVYSFQVEVGNDNIFTQAREVGSLTLNEVTNAAPKTGTYEIVVSPASFVKTSGFLAKYIRLNITVAGTTPIIDFYAWCV